MPDPDLEHPELVDEYITSLQEQLDSLHAKNARLRRRVAKLERERESLQRQLPPWRRRKTWSSDSAPKHHDNTITIPDVGTIPDIELPDGPVARPDLVVAAVLDDFSRSAFRYEFDLRDIGARDVEDALEEAAPDLLLVESAYRGRDGSWAGRIARFGHPSLELERLVEWCRAHGVPSVFWVKEDPINHDWFTASASLFDVVLTVDSNMIDSYRRRLGHERVGLLPFAAQPSIHHPPGDEERPGRLAFAGSYYAAKHSDRRNQMETVLEPSLDYGLHIFDRMNRQEDPRFAWPAAYLSHIVGSLTYPQTLEAYRRYQTFLNVNTVTDSPTMCSRRVYELLASGTRVISGPARALAEVPVEITKSREETRELLSKGARFDPNESVEWVLSRHTMSHRVDVILGYV